MSNVAKFKFPDKKPDDQLTVKDPVPKTLNPEARKIYLRIIRESKPGVLLMRHRIAVEVTAIQTESAITHGGGAAYVDSTIQAFEMLLAPELGDLLFQPVAVGGAAGALRDRALEAVGGFGEPRFQIRNLCADPPQR